MDHSPTIKSGILHLFSKFHGFQRQKLNKSGDNNSYSGPKELRQMTDDNQLIRLLPIKAVPNDLCYVLGFPSGGPAQGDQGLGMVPWILTRMPWGSSRIV